MSLVSHWLILSIWRIPIFPTNEKLSWAQFLNQWTKCSYNQNNDILFFVPIKSFRWFWKIFFNIRTSQKSPIVLSAFLHHRLKIVQSWLDLRNENQSSEGSWIVGDHYDDKEPPGRDEHLVRDYSDVIFILSGKSHGERGLISWGPIFSQ